MTPREATALVESLVVPLPLTQFRESVGASRSFDITGHPVDARTALMGSDPAATVLAGYATHAGKLDSHAVAPTGDVPAPENIDSPQAFAALIATYHARGHTVRVPDLLALSPAAARMARALEAVFMVPVDASLFWSIDRARAKIHYDDNDIVVVQLTGTKRWFVSTDPPGLNNVWKDAAAGATVMPNYRTVDLSPGDLIYVPRGTPHSVESSGTCLHITFTFTPVSHRAALIAAIDHASDLDRRLRTTAPAIADGSLGGALAVLAEQWRTPGFLPDAEEKRRSRFVGSLPMLPKVASAPITPDTRVRHTPLALLHLLPRGHVIDVALPGGHLFVNAAAREALAHIASTSAFRVADLPGLTPDVAVALVERLAAGGVLEVEG